MLSNNHLGESQTAITLIPGDAGTPIANELIDLSSDFLIILLVIYLEKFLLTTIGYAVFTFLIPAACLVLAISIFVREDSTAKEAFRSLAIKLTMFGLAMVFIIPVSVCVSDSIDSSFQESLEITNASIQEATEAIENETADPSVEESNALSNLLAAAQNGWNTLTKGAQDVLDSLGDKLNTLVDTLAVMIVTSCLIPVAVLIFFFWLVNAITGLNLGTSKGVFQSGRKHARAFTDEFRKNKTEPSL